MPSDRASAPPPTISVLLPLPLEGAYDYLAPEEVAAEPGRFVVVPLGNRHVAGVAWGTGKGDVAPEKLKYISAVLDLPPLTDELRALIDWTANYTLNPPGAVLRMAMSIREALEAPRPLTAYRLADGGPAGESPEPAFRLTNARRRVLEFLGDGQPRTLAAIAEETGAAASVVHGLAGLGVVETVALSAETHPPVPDWRRPGPLLSPPQAVAARDLVGQLGAGSVTLLDGVTGSGKTEVYFEAIAAALAQGRQVCVLLPEIALTAQVIERFTRRFGVPPVEWHSDVPRRERRGHWRAILRGEARIVVGARSALFLPYRDLGLIVVDEEHDQSFKQEDGVIYNARDMAVVRGHLGGFPVVLVSATPSLETVVNGWSGRYRLLRLPDRHAGALPPRIEAVDLRKHDMTRQSWISPPLRDALAETLAAGEQSMLFLNRRGYAPLTLCRACGHRLECPNCTAWLVEHRLAGRLMCHHCGYAAPQPESCPECGAVDRFAACGPGVERVAEEAAALLPEARIAVMASDTLSRASAAAELIRRMQAHDIDLLIGTQIVAKGHHFPMLTLVGVIDADLGLSGGDLRASERTYQLLHQVAGRAGREDRPGRVLLQTTDPDHPVMKALVLGDRDGFIAAEAAERKAAGMPPFGRLASILITGPDAEAVDAAGRALARTAPRTDGIAVLGPAPAPLAVVRGRHRVRLLVKAPRETNLQPHLRRWLRQVRIRGSVRVQVDVDPYAFH